MNIRYPGRRAVLSGSMLCICFILIGAVVSCCRANTNSSARPHSIQSGVSNGAAQGITGQKKASFDRAYGRLSPASMANRRRAHGKAVLDERLVAITIRPTCRRLGSSRRDREAEVRRIRQEPANPKAVHGRPPTGKVCDGLASYLRVRMLSTHRDTEVAPEDARPVKMNRFTGDDVGNGHANIPTCKTLLYRMTCPKVDIKYYRKNYPLAAGSAWKFEVGSRQNRELADSSPGTGQPNPMRR